MTRIGVVLGAGGLTGHAYEAGVLAALHDLSGWEPSQADILVGTSAGSIVATFLSAGISADTLAQQTASHTLAPWLDDSGDPMPDIPVLRMRDLVGRPRLPGRTLLARCLTWPLTLPIEALTAAVLPQGRICVCDHADWLTRVVGEWPSHLWVCAYDTQRAERVVLTPDTAPGRMDLGSAVAASCAIPGFFEPVTVGEQTLVDGGTHSVTNADVLADQRLDLVIVVAPLSTAARAMRSSVDALWRRRSRQRLRGEIASLEARGIPVVAFQPDPATQRIMGLNAMSPARTDQIVAHVRADMRERIRAAPEWLDMLAGAGSDPSDPESVPA